MIDQEKVISNLQILREWVEVHPYYHKRLTYSEARKAMDWLDDALELLKAQEPRVMQIREIMEIYKADPSHVWPYNTPPYLYIQEHPHVHNSSEAWAAWREIRDIIEGELFGHTAQSYGKTWRCWTAKPSNEQREGVKWGD